ncbi:hypothetical protein AAG570_003732 [Ranatra chinensis]|uniref:Uncharacterized protein n=1 Tax=Ranatra chinensis TaxID=642074 RepID=A0ABD0Y4X9_9HEMI
MSIRGGIFRPHIQLSQLPPVQQEPLRQDQQQAESLLQQQGLQQQQQGLQQQLQSLQLHQQQQQAEALQRSPEPPTPPRTPHSPQQPPPLQRLITSVSTATQRESPAYQQQPQQSPKTTQTNNFTAPRETLASKLRRRVLGGVLYVVSAQILGGSGIDPSTKPPVTWSVPLAD